MIIHTDIKLEIGKIYYGKGKPTYLSDADGVKHRQSFMVLKEATQQDYINQLIEYNIKPIGRYCTYFYEVSID